MTQEELAAKYHWRIKYPKTYEMALRDKFLEGELPPEVFDQEVVRQVDISTNEFKVARKKSVIDQRLKETDSLAYLLPVAGMKQRRRRGRNQQTELTGKGGVEPSETDINALLEEVLDRLDRIESALLT